MPRTARLLPEIGVFHIITRGNNRQEVFHDKEDYEKYRWILWNVKSDHSFQIYHYCFMPNHVHMLLESSGQVLSVIMKKISLRYMQYYRKKYDYFGHFWQDRFKSLLIGKESYMMECAAYIELNPYKAKLERTLGEYPYSSFKYYGLGEPDPILTSNPYYAPLNANHEERRNRYREFISSRIERWEEYQKYYETKKAMGDEAFLKAIEKSLVTKISRQKRGRPRKLV